MEDKEVYYKITAPERLGDQFVVVRDTDLSLTDYLDGSEHGDVWKVEIIEMSDSEFEALPEFEGF